MVGSRVAPKRIAGLAAPKIFDADQSFRIAKAILNYLPACEPQVDLDTGHWPKRVYENEGVSPRTAIIAVYPHPCVKDVILSIPDEDIVETRADNRFYSSQCVGAAPAIRRRSAGKIDPDTELSTMFKVLVIDDDIETTAPDYGVVPALSNDGFISV